MQDAKEEVRGARGVQLQMPGNPVVAAAHLQIFEPPGIFQSQFGHDPAFDLLRHVRKKKFMADPAKHQAEKISAFHGGQVVLKRADIETPISQ